MRRFGQRRWWQAEWWEGLLGGMEGGEERSRYVGCVKIGVFVRLSACGLWWVASY